MDKHTFGNSKAAVNLIDNILPQYPSHSRRIRRALSKQIEFLYALMDIKDIRVRRASLKMCHEGFTRFFNNYTDCPEVVKTHTLNVETGIYRCLLKRGKE